MPLTNKGQKIEKSMQDQYGAKKGEQVFYASKNKGTITSVESRAALIEGFQRRLAERHRGK